MSKKAHPTDQDKATGKETFMVTSPETPRRTSIMIVGGGPVGLAMGLLLDRFGIDAIIV